MAKQVIDREKSSGIVVAAVRQHGGPIAQAITLALAPFLRGRPMPDVALLVELVGDLVAHNAAALVEASEAHDRELSDDAEPRARRDDREKALRPAVTRLRTLVEGTYGEPGLQALGLFAPPEPGPDAIRSYARAACKALVDPAVVLVPVNAPGVVELRPAAYAALLLPMVEALDTAITHVARERKEADTTLLGKQDALTAHDHSFVRFAGLIEQFARAAGLDALADRIRPSGRDPGVLAEPLPEPLPEEGALPSPARPTATDAATPKVRIPPGMPGASPFMDEPEEP